MKRILFCALMSLMMMASLVAGQTLKGGPQKSVGEKPVERKPGKAEQQILVLNRAWADSIVGGDMARLDELFAEEMTVTSSSGSVRDKAAEMDELRPTPEGKTYFFNTDDVRVRVYRDAAVLTGLASWRFQYKGKEVDNQMRYTHVYIKRKGRWQIVAQQLTRPAAPARTAARQ